MSVKPWFVCASFLGLLWACCAPALAQNVSLVKVDNVNPGAGLPAYVGHFTMDFAPPAGQPLDSPLSLTTDYDITWVADGGVSVLASCYSQMNSLPYSAAVGGFVYDINPTSYAISYNSKGQVTVPSRPDGSATSPPNAYITGVAAPYLIGLMLFKVHDSAGKPVAGTVVTWKNYSRNGYSAGWEGQYPAFNSGRMVLGQGMYVAGDNPYPPGLATDRYVYVFASSGYTTCQAYFPTGSQSAGQTVDVTLMPSGTASAITVSPSSSTDNPDQPPPASGGSGSGSLFDLGAFFDKLQSVATSWFTLDPADLNALKTAASNLFTYGPLGVPAAVIAALNTAFGGTNTGTSPSGGPSDYWTFYLYASDAHPETRDPTNNTASLAAAPSGYNPAGIQVPGHVPTIYDSMFPRSLDLLPYAGDILIGRRLALVALWLTVSLGLLHRFTPQLRI